MLCLLLYLDMSVIIASNELSINLSLILSSLFISSCKLVKYNNTSSGVSSCVSIEDISVTSLSNRSNLEVVDAFSVIFIMISINHL